MHLLFEGVELTKKSHKKENPQPPGTAGSEFGPNQEMW
jgi:hypothetical protein